MNGSHHRTGNARLPRQRNQIDLASGSGCDDYSRARRRRSNDQCDGIWSAQQRSEHACCKIDGKKSRACGMLFKNERLCSRRIEHERYRIYETVSKRRRCVSRKINLECAGRIAALDRYDSISIGMKACTSQQGS